jgi:hypothetical protein
VAFLCTQSSCGLPSHDYHQVDVNKYANILHCWTQGDRNVALMVIDTIGSKNIPHFISPFCDVKVFGYEKSEGILAMSTSIRVAGDQGKLKALGFINKIIDSNAYDHVRFPRRDSSIYIIKFEIIEKSIQGSKFYEFGKIFEFCNLGISLDQYQKYNYTLRNAVAHHRCN